ncbi:hypothetical protein PInf_007233 [Phytophthora infestans]|nr:hypothetical protein PInf_007233 [Phytophthora infestans]
MITSAVRIKIQQALAREMSDPRRDPSGTTSEEDLKQELDPPQDQGKEDPIWIETTDQNSEEVEPRWIRAQHAFVELRNRIATTPILRHFDPERQPTVIVYASDWAALVQEHEGICHPVTFVSRTLKPNELNYGAVEKEILALLRVLDLNYNLLVGRSIRILTRHSTLAWLFKSAGLQGRLGQWAALLSPWTLEIVKCSKGEDEILGVLAASITPRAKMDEALTRIAPKKEPKRRTQIPIPTKVMVHLRGWMNHELVHVKRDWNASADSLASAALRNQCGVEVEREAEHQDLVTLNRLDEVVMVGSEKRTVQVMAVTRSRGRIGSSPQILDEAFVKGVRIERILKAQNEEAWILGLKKYLMGDVRDLRREDTKSYSIIASDYAVDLSDLLFYCPPTKKVSEDRDGLMRLVVPEPYNRKSYITITLV